MSAAVRALGALLPGTDDHNLALWQGRVASAAENGGGLDIFRAALEAVKRNAPPDRALLEHSKSEIWSVAERHLADVHGVPVLEAIFFNVFPEDADQGNNTLAINNELDAIAVKIDDRNVTDAEIKRLAALSPLTYDRVREGEAKRLRVRVSTLDQEVTTARGQAENPENSEDADANAFLADPEPWPEPVSGSALLDWLTQTVRGHLVLPSGAAESISLWVLHAHAHDYFGISPVLGVTSPTPECGKTTCLTLLGALVPRACPASNITAAALFRAVDKWQPTLLIDEADSFLRSSDELRGVLNSGHQRASAFVIRTTGDEHEPKRFRTWAPKAVALIGKLPATLASRAIHIELRRKTAAENVKPLRLDRLNELEPLRRQAARWTADNAISLRSADPKIPDALSGRAADNWRPLLAIADLAGGEWPARARRIAGALGGGRTEQTASIKLLEDIQRISADRGVDRLPSADLSEALSALEDRPWPEWHQGKPITPRQIAKLLEPFGITPGTIRTTSGTAKGYRLLQFTDAFARYLPDPAKQSVTPSQLTESASFGTFRSATPSLEVTDENTQKMRINGGCDGVTVPSAASLERDV